MDVCNGMLTWVLVFNKKIAELQREIPCIGLIRLFIGFSIRQNTSFECSIIANVCLAIKPAHENS